MHGLSIRPYLRLGLTRHYMLQKHPVQRLVNLITSVRINISKSVSRQLSRNRQFPQKVVFLSIQSRPGTAARHCTLNG